MNKTIHIFSGGTTQPIATHLALSAPAYGQVGRQLEIICKRDCPELSTFLHLTKMADPFSEMVTNEDVEKRVMSLVEKPSTKIIFMPVALCDFEPVMLSKLDVFDQVEKLEIGKHAPRLQTRGAHVYNMRLVAASKVIGKIRKNRKDVFLVGFKTTDGASEDEQYITGLNLLKEASCNLVLANDVKTKLNMVITPEEARYHVTTHRLEALSGLVEMAKLRSHLTFTRSTVISGEPVPWSSDLIPGALRDVVNYCIKNNAYKPFRGATVGHFAVKLDDKTFLTSQRKTNFNDLERIGLVKVVTDGPDTVLAYGAKPSVGGQSQRIIFNDHPEYDAVVHFHCPIKPGSKIPTVSQREVECGSHACGKQTSKGLKKFGSLSAVYLDQHGPNIVFNSKTTKPSDVTKFIDENFDLSAKTGGYVTL